MHKAFVGVQIEFWILMLFQCHKSNYCSIEIDFQTLNAFIISNSIFNLLGR